MPRSEGQRIFTLILEPVKGCNLRCSYCYSDTDSGAVMSRHTLRVAVESAVQYAQRHDFTKIHILWHGGEPLLADLEFFRQAARMIAELNAGLAFQQFIQTNGLLLDRDFCRFFRKNDVQIGLSLDGPPDLHDALRIYPDGAKSHGRVLDKHRLLTKNGLSAGFNAVITRRSLGREKEIYRYFQALNSGFRVNPLIPMIGSQKSTPELLRQGEYGRFLCGLFDAWTGTEAMRIPISPLDVYLKAILKNATYECQQRPMCVGSNIGVKPNGDAVLCSRFETHILGNINEMNFDALFASPFCETIRQRAEMLTDCHSCAHWTICYGGCPHNALVFCQNPTAKDFFCKDYQLVFGKIRRALNKLNSEGPLQGEP